MADPVIDSVRIASVGPEFMCHHEVIVTFAGSEEEKMIIRYYPDEISFREAELLGLTEKQASDLWFQKDKAYLLNGT
ncbi:hypothetical protein EBZ80_21270 [bacterium]|nr:hypothetical protein [Betaproteobacteria bacterium]NDE17462.1 hypothetical protein [bacterium]